MLGQDPTRTYCLIAWTRSTMFSLPQVLQAQCLVSLKCRVNHTCLATSQCQQGNLTILLPTFGQIVWFNWKKTRCSDCSRWIWSEHCTDAHHLSPYNMGQCRFSEYTCSYCIRVLSWKARMAVHQKQFPQSTRCMQHGGVCWRSVAEWRRWSLIWEEESFPILASLLQRTWRILFFLGSSRRLFKRSRISAQILASWVSH